MKNRILPNPGIVEIGQFIHSSFEEFSEGNLKHLNFYKDLITHYFEAKNVEIYYEQKKVTAEIAVGNDFIPIYFNCLDLPTFISSCIKEDAESLENWLNYVRQYKIHSNLLKEQI